MSGNHTAGLLQVRIDSTSSGAWPVIVERCIDPKTNEEWFREVGRTETAFVENCSRRERRSQTVGTYNEAPGRFKPTDESAESIANAHLFAGAGGMLVALRQAQFAMEMAKWHWKSEASTDMQRDAHKQVCDAIATAMTITPMVGGD